jgi:adenine phosphoribosyltransferase
MKKQIVLLIALFFFSQDLTALESQWIQRYLTATPDFPQRGIVFQSYEKLLKDPAAFHRVIGAFADRYRDRHLDAIVGLDARGFIFGSALAYELNVPFVMMRKPGKLPGKVERVEYSLEYGKNAFELEVGIVSPGDRVVIIDDLLATGGSAQAAVELVERLGGEVVETAFFIELSFLHGREKIRRPVFSLLALEKE